MNNNTDMEKIKSTVRMILAVLILLSIIAGVYLHILGGKNKIGGASNFGKKNENTIELNGNVTDIDMQIAIGDVNVKRGDSLKVCYDMPKNLEPVVKLDDGKLSIASKSDRNVNLPMLGNTGAEITIILPGDTKLNKMSMEVNVGDICVEEIDVEAISITSDVGDIDINNIECKNGEIIQAAGDVTMAKVNISKLNISSDLGDVELDGDFDEVTVESDLGDIKLRSEKSESDMKLDFTVDMGSVEVNGRKIKD